MAPTPSIENVVAHIAVQERKSGGGAAVQLATVNEALVSSGFEARSVKKVVKEAVKQGVVKKGAKGTVRIAG